jgi:hypothetical protein
MQDLEVNSDGTLVRTKVPVRPDRRREFRTIHVEGLSKDETLESLQELFHNAIGRVLRIDRRTLKLKGGEQVFSGSANVELETEEAAQAAVENGIRYRGQVLQTVLLPEFKSTLKESASAEKKERGGKRSPRQGRGRR